nr:caltractin-like [Halyomorpha halys]
MKDRSSRIELERAFQLMDKEEKGFISIDDLRRVAKDIGEIISEEEMQEMIDEADSSNTGHVSKEDFLNFMNKVQDNGTFQ